MVTMSVLSCVVGMRGLAQQKPHYTQYILNQYIVNPALTGIENYIDVKLSHRHQWVGIQDAPVTSYLSVHGPIGKKDFRTTATSFETPGENPRGKQYWQDFTAAEAHHGEWAGMIFFKARAPSAALLMLLILAIQSTPLKMIFIL